MRPLLLLVLLAACAHQGPTALPAVRGASTYRVGLVAASGRRTVTSVHTLRVVPRGAGVVAVTTEHAEGTWEEGAAAITWDAAAPKGSDPWPVVLQHAISSVPAPIRIDDGGSPIALDDVETWKRAARSAVAQVGLPEQAQASAAALLDPDGVVRDLRRYFPGTPPAEGPWVREETIAGLAAQRHETCTRASERGTTTWTCEGEVVGPTEGPARLVLTRSTTTLSVDARGLSQLDSTYEGTLIVLDADGRRALDRPVAGQRRVVRSGG